MVTVAPPVFDNVLLALVLTTTSLVVEPTAPVAFAVAAYAAPAPAIPATTTADTTSHLVVARRARPGTRAIDRGELLARCLCSIWVSGASSAQCCCEGESGGAGRVGLSWRVCLLCWSWWTWYSIDA